MCITCVVCVRVRVYACVCVYAHMCESYPMYLVVMVGMEGEEEGEGGWTILTAEVMTLHFTGVLSGNSRLQEKESQRRLHLCRFQEVLVHILQLNMLKILKIRLLTPLNYVYMVKNLL